MREKFQAPFRQIHMDFHTHGLIENVGKQFDAEEFALTLKRAHVNSVTCFARCHHGWMYYDSKLFPERVHPHLVNRNLLAEQIDACHRHGLRVPVYTTIQWDDEIAREHPEWRVVTPDGKFMGTPPYEAGFYRYLCYNTPYRDFLKAHVREVLEGLPLDGMFFDIVRPRDCSCHYCQAAMLARGQDPSDAEVRMAYARESMRGFMDEMSALTWSLRPAATTYYNNNGLGPRLREQVPALTHVEFDVLPSSSPEGYLEFPLLTRYQRNLGLDCVGQTGRFHRTWGDFHAYKNQAALEYDCFYLLSQGCQVLIGDQLLPSGKIDPVTYDLVGAVYSQVERKEPYCRGARPVVDIGVLHPEEFDGPAGTGHGLIRLLEEGAHQFDLIDSRMDFSPYKVLILPDCIPVGEPLKARLDAYLARGGKLLASFESGMHAGKTDFALDALGVACLGPGPIAADGLPARGRKFQRIDYADYLLPRGPIGAGLPATEHVMYTNCLPVRAQPGAEVLVDVILSEFDRSFQHFVSHNQSPSSGRVGSAGIVRNGNCLYFAHKIFEQYSQYASPWVKRLFLNGLDLLLPDPLLRHDGPSTLLATVTEQTAHQRWIVHLLHYIPQRRATELEIIEDVIPLRQVKVSLKLPRAANRVLLQPGDGGPLETWEAGGRLEFAVPEIRGHQMVSVEFT
jgi:hypothetical protein